MRRHAPSDPAALPVLAVRGNDDDDGDGGAVATARPLSRYVEAAGECGVPAARQRHRV